MDEYPVVGTLIRNLPNKRKLGKQNPYCIARLGADAKRSAADVRGGQTPGWDHEVRFDVREHPDHKQLKLSVLDENDSKPDLVGDTVIPLDAAFEAHPSQGYDHWHEIQLKGKYAGEVYIEMTYYPAKPNLPPKPKKKKKTKRSIKSGIESVASFGSSRPLPMQPGQSASSSETSLGPAQAQAQSQSQPQSQTPQPQSAPVNMPELPEFDNLSLREQPRPSPPRELPPHAGYGDVNMYQQLPPSSQYYHYQQQYAHPPPPPPDGYYGFEEDEFDGPQHSPQYYSQTPQPIPSSHTPLPPIPEPPASAPPNRIRRKPVGAVTTTPSPPAAVRRKPVGINGPYSPQFDEDEVPFSASGYNTANPSLPPVPQTPAEEYLSEDVLDYTTYAPEPVLPTHRPSKRLPDAPAMPVDPGAGYTGDGQWDVDQINERFNDSLFNRVIRGNLEAPEASPPPPPRMPYYTPEHQRKPNLPPKIPMGMTREEYYAAEPVEEEDPYHYRVYA